MTTSRTSRAIRSRSASEATRAPVTMTDSSAGISRIRSSCSMVRVVTIRGAVSPETMPSISSSRFAAMKPA